MSNRSGYTENILLFHNCQLLLNSLYRTLQYHRKTESCSNRTATDRRFLFLVTNIVVCTDILDSLIFYGSLGRYFRLVLIIFAVVAVTVVEAVAVTVAVSFAAVVAVAAVIFFFFIYKQLLK